jgi:hypothetical protein
MNVPSYFYWEIEKLKQNMSKSHDIKIHLKIYNDIRYCDTITSISNNSDIIINLYMDMDMKSKIIDNKIYDKRNMSVEHILENIDTILDNLDNSRIVFNEKNLKEYLCKTFDLHLTIGESEELMATIKRYLENVNYSTKTLTKSPQPDKHKTPRVTKKTPNISSVNNNKIKLKIKKKPGDTITIPEPTPQNNVFQKIADSTIVKPIAKKNTIDITMLESIILNDHMDERCELFIHNDKLYSINRKHVGFIRDWIDDKDEVPSDYKNNDGKVLNPDNNLPIMEIEITAKGSCITGLGDGLYREYEYDELLEIFRKTNYIQKD